MDFLWKTCLVFHVGGSFGLSCIERSTHSSWGFTIFSGIWCLSYWRVRACCYVSNKPEFIKSPVAQDTTFFHEHVVATFLLSSLWPRWLWNVMDIARADNLQFHMLVFNGKIHTCPIKQTFFNGRCVRLYFSFGCKNRVITMVTVTFYILPCALVSLLFFRSELLQDSSPLNVDCHQVISITS
jgi:hypothetical protein